MDEAPIPTRTGSVVFSDQSLKMPVPASIAEARAILCEVVRKAVIKHLGENLIALILTGSEARGEGSFRWSPEGTYLLGDAEFIVVTGHQPARNGIASLGQKIESTLARRGVHARIGIGVVQRNYLRQLPRHIYSYELRLLGRVIAGDPNILTIIPEFPVSDIAQEDAWRLLCNRIIELLSCTESVEQRRDAAKFQYALVKLLLDTATSLLVFVGSYEPTYRARAKKLAAVQREKHMPEVLPFPLDEFVRTVSLATKWKLDPQGEPEIEGPKVISHAIQLWRWEVAHLSSSQNGSSVREIWSQFAQRQTSAQKLRGWLYVARRQGWIKSWRNWARWIRLGWRASPRYWVYLVAVELLSRRPLLPGSAADLPNLISDFKSLQTLLPDRPKETEAFRSEWSDLVRNVVWNYKRFLVETRA